MTAKTLLLVEDNPQDELLTLRALGKVGLADRVVIVRDGQQALDYLFCQGEFAGRDGQELPRVMLLDLNLPRLGGMEVLARVRAHPRVRRLPVVVLTSSDEVRDRQGSYAGGANSFVRKPLDFAEFAATVGRVGLYWHETNEPAAG